MKRILLACLASAMLATVGGSAQAAGESDLAQAHEAVENYRYGVALNHFRDAAAKGNLRAQRIVGQMLMAGEALYGPEVRRDRAEGERWLALAAANGCEISRRLLAKARSQKSVAS